MSRLNYSKWDALELSDDSDIEVHPNIDKKSWIRFKQRDIHEKREQRKGKIANLKMELEMNGVMLPRMDDILVQLRKEGVPFIEREAGRLGASKDATKPTGSTGPSYDEMMASLLQQVAKEVREKKIPEADRYDVLRKGIETHRQQLVERTEAIKKEIVHEEAEQRKHITSEDIHEGFNAGHVNPNAASQQPFEKPKAVVAPPKPDKGKGKAQAIEVLNPSASATTPATKVSSQPDKDSGNDSDEELPEVSDAVRAFARIPSNRFPDLFQAISKQPSLLTAANTDALLVEAFNAAMKGDDVYAYQCVHQGLLLQYCGKLGKDGVALFFKRMDQGPARKVFEDDVTSTYQRLSQRAKVVAAEQAAEPKEGTEQIQLVATDDNTKIDFDVPEGPPPEQLVLEGEGTEGLDIEDVRRYLQNRWDVFDSFPPNLKKALAANDLKEVNRVLGVMAVDEAEEVVAKLDEARILNFQTRDIVDKTGAGAEAGSAL